MVGQSRDPAAADRSYVTVARAMRMLEMQSRTRMHEHGWVETGAVADVLGVSVGEAAASLRAASRIGLCSRRRSLLHGTVWRLSRTGIAGVVESIEP
jgi:hypothetical protein